MGIIKDLKDVVKGDIIHLMTGSETTYEVIRHNLATFENSVTMELKNRETGSHSQAANWHYLQAVFVLTAADLADETK